MRADFFNRLPSPTVVLLLASIFDLTSARFLQPLPRQTPTTTVAHRVLDVVPWPLLPTVAPLSPFDLRRRQDPNTICGYLGGNSDLPATCSAGSHCVLEKEHGVVGCCPDREPCTAGIYTGCVDANSGPQTQVNPYVFTCGGGNVCYQNAFEGGFSQFGCGTASDLATTVLAAASGITTGTLDRPTVSVPFTQDVTTLSDPTTLGTRSSTSSTSSRSSTTSSSSSRSSSTSTSSTSSNTSTRSSSSTSSTATPSSSDTAAPAAVGNPSGGDTNRVGTIVGATIGGLAFLIALGALAFFWLRHKRGNLRSGPGPNGPGGPGAGGMYISDPKTGSGGTGFTPIHQSNDAFETGILPPVAGANGQPLFSTDLTAGGPSPFAYHGAGTHASYPPAEGYHYPGQYPAAYAGAGTGVAGVGAGAGMAVAHGAQHGQGMEPDQIPLTREIDEFSHSYQQALGRIGEEDEERDRLGTGGTSSALSGTNDESGTSGMGPQDPNGDGARPLWQQNRRQSRNLMWM